MFDLIDCVVLALNISYILCEWQLIWSDQFNHIDNNKWFVERRYSDGTCFSPNSAHINNGTLNIKAVINPDYKVISSDSADTSNCPLYSTSIYSMQNWTYGKFEIKALFHSNTGDAQILLRPQSLMYESNSESVSVIIFYKFGFGYSYGVNTKNLFPLDYETRHQIQDDFHVFTVEWDKNGINFIIDNKLYHNFKFDQKLYRNDKLGTYEQIGQPFDQNLNLYIQTFANSRTRPNEIILQVDYIKVYKWLQTVSNEDNKYKVNIYHVLLTLTIILSIISIALFCFISVISIFYRLKLSKLPKRSRTHIKEYK